MPIRKYLHVVLWLTSLKSTIDGNANCSLTTDSAKWTVVGVCSVYNGTLLKFRHCFDDIHLCRWNESLSYKGNVTRTFDGHYSAARMYTVDLHCLVRCSFEAALPALEGKYLYTVEIDKITTNISLEILSPEPPSVSSCPMFAPNSKENSVTCNCTTPKYGHPPGILTWPGYSYTSQVTVSRRNQDSVFTCQLTWGAHNWTVVYNPRALETTTSAAEVTTSHGHHDITCTESRMEFSIPLSSPHTSETATLSDPNCQINVTRTHVRGGVDLNSCGTTVQFQNDSVIFRNAIIFSAPESSSLGSSGSNSSVSQYQDIIPIQCVYNRLATVHLSYMPVVRRVLFTESGVGQFSFNIQQFWDASFTNMVSDGAYPLRMELDADVFIQLSVGSEGQPVAGHKEIGMEVQQCLVSPSSSVIEAQLHYYPLIQDGCPASSDVHIIPNTNASDSTVMRFRFRAVNFFDPSSSSSSSLVFVHCRMGLCLTGSCKPSAWSCLTPPARRVRRDVDQSKRAAHQLSTGPFLIMADEASTSSSSTTATVMAVVSTSVATVAIVIAAIALIALRRRRTTERN